MLREPRGPARCYCSSCATTVGVSFTFKRWPKAAEKAIHCCRTLPRRFRALADLLASGLLVAPKHKLWSLYRLTQGPSPASQHPRRQQRQPRLLVEH